MQAQLSGLWPPVVTPFDSAGAVDHRRLVRQCRALLDEGATGLAILGTTSEANSLALDERRNVIDALVAAGIPGDKLLPGTGACAIKDAATLTRHAGEIGAAGVLLLPPFYYKGVSDDGLFAFVSEVIERAGPKVPRIMLYHIPPMAGVGWPLALMARLRNAFPDLIAGMKDSSGNYEHTRSVIEAFPDLAIFPGAEVYLLQALADGAAGCISATANINARAIVGLINHWREPDAERRQEALNAVRKAVDTYDRIPAIKAVIAARYRDDSWLRVRPPLMPLSRSAHDALLAEPALAALPKAEEVV